MRVVILGGTGNVGTSVIEQLVDDSRVESIVGVARRRPDWRPPGVHWSECNVVTGDLEGLLTGADAAVHLAWAFQPSRRPVATWNVNVLGTTRVLDAVARARVPTLVLASSVAAYSPADKARRVDESWPTHGWSPAAYCREKAYVERLLDRFEVEVPNCRVVRMRPCFLLKRSAAPEQRRIFAGPLAPERLLGRLGLPVVPDLSGLQLQAMHTDDAARAYVEAIWQEVHGAFNLAADPVVDASVIAEVFGGRRVRLPARPARALLAALWHTRLIPVTPDLLDYVLQMPLMDSSRAQRELNWNPRHSAAHALREFRAGLGGAGFPTPPLVPSSTRAEWDLRLPVAPSHLADWPHRQDNEDQLSQARQEPRVPASASPRLSAWRCSTGEPARSVGSAGR